MPLPEGYVLIAITDVQPGDRIGLRGATVLEKRPAPGRSAKTLLQLDDVERVCDFGYDQTFATRPEWCAVLRALPPAAEPPGEGGEP